MKVRLLGSRSTRRAEQTTDYEIVDLPFVDAKEWFSLAQGGNTIPVVTAQSMSKRFPRQEGTLFG